MSDPSAPPPYAAYLDAKKSVDDRALSQHVLGVLRRELDAEPRPVRVLEVGAGVGTMVARLVDWGILQRAHYTLLDADEASLREAPRWLAAWAAASGRTTSTTAGALRIEGGDPTVDITVQCIHSVLEAFLEAPEPGQAPTLLIANAFLDLVDVPTVLPALFQRLAPEGLYWFTINFDGETVFMPEHAADLPLMAAYHRSMDERVRDGHPAGDSRAGRHLFQRVRAAGGRVLAAGSSDWVVHPIDREYPAREREFVAYILHTIEAELSRHADVDPQQLQAWLTARRHQLEQGELVYMTHQLDFMGRRGRSR